MVHGFCDFLKVFLKTKHHPKFLSFFLSLLAVFLCVFKSWFIHTLGGSVVLAVREFINWSVYYLPKKDVEILHINNVVG